MSFINYSAREINCKIVYYGPKFRRQDNKPPIYIKRHPPDARVR